MITYRTKSESIYDVDGRMVRRRIRGQMSGSKRVSTEWREAASIECRGVGHPLVIVWGLGVDEHSEADTTWKVGLEDTSATRVRTTITSTVMAINDSERDVV